MASPPELVGRSIEEAMKKKMRKQCGPGSAARHGNSGWPSEIAARTNEPRKAV